MIGTTKMLSTDDLRFAIEDARTRHEAVVGLIYFIDQQAMALLALYVTLGLATAGGFVIGLTNSTIPGPLSAALLTATIMLGLGGFFCFQAMQTAVLNLPGRQAEFWQWADSQEITPEEAYREYLRNLQDKHALNDGVNARTSFALRCARVLGVFTPASALLAGGIILGLGAL